MKPPAISPAPLERQPGEPSAALSRAAEVWPEANRISQLASILQTVDQTPPRFLLLATERAPQGDALPTGALLVECLPGRSAIVMAPQIDPELDDGSRGAIAAALLQALDQQLIKRGVLLAQGLTHHRHQPACAWFAAAGFRDVGDLLYLTADLKAVTQQPLRSPLGGPLALLPHSPQDFDRWVPLVEKTYINSLDCPAVDGLRPTREVLIGYQDIGVPRDDWSFLVQHEGRDVGCLLLADHSPAKHAELVYMGLIPEVRGRGWGVFVAQEAQRIAAAAGAEHLVLTVDADNRPALRNYQAAGFRFWEQRAIWVKAYPA
jgi:GNAT superfamily N-acetyltransferase